MYFTKFKIFKFGEKNTGFTIIEMLVVISIMILISGSMLLGYKSGEDQRRLNIDSQKLVQILRKAQNYAMSAKEESGCGNNKVTPYGISFNSGSATNYLFIADCNDDKHYDGINGDILVSTISLSDSIISSVSPSFLEIFFAAPIPSTYITGGSETGTITLCSKRRTSLCKSIIINVRGAISVQ
jgi:prepilin-type N-terminal cleavage/methylation domain-containing protein